MLHAVLLAIAADGLLALMDAIVKTMTVRYSTFQIAFLRFGFGFAWASLLLVCFRPSLPSRETIVFNTTRSVLAVITATSFFYALSQLPLADAVALAFLSPMFTALFGALFLGERIDARIVTALMAGFAGLVLIAGGRVGSGTYSYGAVYGAIACVISAITYALTLVLLRARAQRDSFLIIVWFQNVGPALMLAPAAALAWTAMNARDLAIFILVGFLGVAGHLLLASAFSRAEAARLAPIHYITLAWGVVFGYLFFAELPGLTTLAGAGLIVLGTIATHRPKSEAPATEADRRPV